MKNVLLVFFLFLYYHGLTQIQIIEPPHPIIPISSLELKKNYTVW